jgi:PAS domain S-box
MATTSKITQSKYTELSSSQVRTFFIVVREDGSIDRTSSSVEQVLDFQQVELNNKYVLDVVHPDDKQVVREMLHELRSDQTTMTEPVEYRHETANGEYKLVSSVGSSEENADSHHVINTKDISNNENLGSQTTAIDWEADDLVSVVSHDLRNPLHIASGYVQQVNMTLDAENDDAEEYIEKIMSAHQRMERLIENILTLADSGKSAEDLEWVDSKSLCEQCLRNLPISGEKVRINIEGEILSDRSRLGQIIENLLTNAVTHGGDDVTVTIDRIDGGDGFYVADDGKGIPAEQRDQIFQTGFSTSSDGIGLGLSIVHEVVQSHGWTINVTEGIDGGARFEICDVDIR